MNSGINQNTFTINIDRDKRNLTVVPSKSVPTYLSPGDTVKLKVGSGWGVDDDPYIYRLHVYAPDGHGGPNHNKSQGAWQCDCPSKDSGDPITKLYGVSSTGTRPTEVTLVNQGFEALPADEFSHFLTGRVAWGPTPSDPCSDDRDNLTFDPELIDRAGTPPLPPHVRIYRFVLAFIGRIFGWRR